MLAPDSPVHAAPCGVAPRQPPGPVCRDPVCSPALLRICRVRIHCRAASGRIQIPQVATRAAQTSAHASARESRGVLSQASTMLDGRFAATSGSSSLGSRFLGSGHSLNLSDRLEYSLRYFSKQPGRRYDCASRKVLAAPRRLHLSNRENCSNKRGHLFLDLCTNKVLVSGQSGCVARWTGSRRIVK